ncbi:hypothetical protein SRABI80_03340 [Peribacillus frigoritolerans]|nr:hypothetical protein SRABI80_03340 [Peribacillus frigoritolerans]
MAKTCFMVPKALIKRRLLLYQIALPWFPKSKPLKIQYQNKKIDILKSIFGIDLPIKKPVMQL